jgi:hypothetical protein
MQPFDTYVMPISGVDFVRYIAFISFLAQYRSNKNLPPFTPKTIYCASGGCLTAYVALMSDFTTNIEAWNVSSNMFIKRSTPFTPRLLTLALRGFLYHRAELTDYLRQIFIPHKLLNVEIITGFYEKGSGKPDEHCIQIVTNRPRDLSIIKDLEPATNTTHITYADPLPPQFFDQDTSISLPARKQYLDRLSDISIDAMHNTSNIPYVAAPRGERKAIDFGIVSPTTRIVANAKIDKGIYFSPINIDLATDLEIYSAIFHNLLLNDYISLKNTFEQSSDFPTMDGVISFLPQCSRYCLVLFTPTKVGMPVDNFTASDAKKYVNICKSSIKIRLLFDQNA